MSIELQVSDHVPEPVPSRELPSKCVTFESRKAGFRIESTNRQWYSDGHAVSLRVGPIGLDLNADEAEAVGKALVLCAEQYRAAVAKAGGQ